jgi:hypothetical protein
MARPKGAVAGQPKMGAYVPPSERPPIPRSERRVLPQPVRLVSEADTDTEVHLWAARFRLIEALG